MRTKYHRIKIFSRVLLVVFILVALIISIIQTVSIEASDGDPYYWAPVAGSGSGNWSDVAHWSSTNDGTGGDYATAPNATNDVFFASTAFTGAGQVVTVNVDGVCASVDWTGSTNTPTFSINSAKSLEVSGNVTFIADMISDPSGTGILRMMGGALTSNGLSLTMFIYFFSGTNSLADDIVTSYIIQGYTGTFNSNNHTITCARFASHSSADIVFNLGTSILNCGEFQLYGGVTIGAGNHSIRVAGTGVSATGLFAGAGKTYYEVQLNGTAHTITGNNSFTTLKFTGSGAQTITLPASGTQTITGTFTATGSSTANRCTIVSSTPATRSTINAATVAVTKATINDLIGAGAGSWDLHASDVLQGANSCSGLVFGLYWYKDGGSWDNLARWSSVSGGPANAVVIPDATTNVYYDANSFTADSQTVVMGVESYFRDYDWTGATHTPTVGSNLMMHSYGNWTTNTGVIWGRTASAYVEFHSTCLFTSGGMDFNFGEELLPEPGGNLILQDELKNTFYLAVNGGTLNTNNQTVTTQRFHASDTNGPYVLSLGSSIINVIDYFFWLNAGNTVNAGTSSIRLTGTAYLDVNGHTLNEVQLNGTAHLIKSSGTYTNLIFASGVTQTITFTDGTTQTVTNPTISGSAGHIHTLEGSGAGGWAITKAGGGAVTASYISISHSTGNPAATWSADGTSINGGSNSGWTFVALSPTVTTSTATSIGETTGTGGANVTDDGGATITERGVCVATTSDPDLTKTVFTTTGTTGVFTVSITGLNSNTTYHLRGYATNSVDISYSDDITFTTLSPPPPTAGINLANIVLPVILLMAIIYGALRFVAKSEYSDNRMVVIVLITVIMLVGLAILTAVQGILNGL